jgi:hypothetical protein
VGRRSALRESSLKERWRVRLRQPVFHLSYCIDRMGDLDALQGV